jgi:uncharacterized membrane protein
MKSKVTMMGHAVHPMLVSFPIVFFVSAVIGYVTFRMTGDNFWFRLGYFSNIAGVIMGIVAAIPGLIDWATVIPQETTAKRTGLVHMSLNSASLLLFLINALTLRGQWYDTTPDPKSSVLLSVLGLACTLGAGFYGWNLVQKHHLGVDMTNPEDVEIEQSQRFTTNKPFTSPV